MAEEDTNWQVVENGLDYLASSIEEAADGGDERLKYAVLHLHAAVETLVKARLARVHWALTVSKLDNAKMERYLSGDFQSAGADACLQRLRDIAGLPVTNDHLAVVDRVARLRNRAAHFALGDEPAHAVRATVADGLHFALWFIEHHLRPKAPPDEAAAIDGTLAAGASALGRIAALVAARMQALQPELDAPDPVVECAQCGQEAMRLHDSGARCLFCLHRPGTAEAADEYVSHVLGQSHYVTAKDGGHWPVEECPECGRDALVEGVAARARPDVRWACFACGHWARSGSLIRCSRCGALTTSNDGLDVCGTCLDHIHGSD